MLDKKISRRDMLRHTGRALAGSALAGCAACVPSPAKKNRPDTAAAARPFRISLNVSTISGYKWPVLQQIEACAKAGFDGIELWTRDVEGFVQQGGSYAQIRKQLESAKLKLENMIGFSSWAADDAQKRQQGLRQIRHDMEMTAALGGRFIAAPMQGVAAFDRARLEEYAGRYRAVLKLGDELGVIPILELWGAGALSKLSDAAAIAIASGHPQAALLLDFYHLYRGENSFDSLRLLNGKSLPVFHINDYPAYPPRAELKDSDRVFPGDGVCPFRQILPLLYDSGFRGSLSVELFNRGYWEKMPAEEVLKQSFEKTARVVDEAFRTVG